MRRAAIPGAAIAAVSLATLGALVGWVGASRAYSVGVHTLYRDHLVAVVFVLVASAVAAAWLGRRAGSVREVFLAIAVVFAVDVAAAVLITLVIPEMRRYPDLLRAVLAETAGGAQLLAVAVGAALGFVTRTRRVRAADTA